MDRSDRDNFAGDGVSGMEDVIRRPNNPSPTESDSDSDTVEQRQLQTTDRQSVNPISKEVGKKKCTLTVQEAIELAKKKGETGPDPGIECSVCLQPCIHPVQLPCKHIFCFLCVKGAANRSKRCALCRQEMPQDFFQNPRLVRQEDLEQTVRFDEEFQWFYEGRNGWWQYDDRTSQEIEVKFKENDKTFELLIAGFLYVIDLENMVQFRRNDRTRKRKIKRDRTSSPDIKGIAGLKYPHQVSTRPGGDGGESAQVAPPVISPPATDHSNDDNLLTSPPAPNNTPQTPQTPADSPPSSVSSSHQDLSAHFQHLNLADHGPSIDQARTDNGHISTHFPVLYSNSNSDDES